MTPPPLGRSSARGATNERVAAPDGRGVVGATSSSSIGSSTGAAAGAARRELLRAPPPQSTRLPASASSTSCSATLSTSPCFTIVEKRRTKRRFALKAQYAQTAAYATTHTASTPAMYENGAPAATYATTESTAISTAKSESSSAASESSFTVLWPIDGASTAGGAQPLPLAAAALPAVGGIFAPAGECVLGLQPAAAPAEDLSGAAPSHPAARASPEPPENASLPDGPLERFSLWRARVLAQSTEPPVAQTAHILTRQISKLRLDSAPLRSHYFEVLFDCTLEKFSSRKLLGSAILCAEPGRNRIS